MRISHKLFVRMLGGVFGQNGKRLLCVRGDADGQHDT
jgi:hypothetical protein